MRLTRHVLKRCVLKQYVLKQYAPNPRVLKRYALTLGLATTLGACGLFPGGGTRVLSVTPPDGATNVGRNTSVVARLSLDADISVTTLTGESVSLSQAGKPVASRAALSEDGRTLTLTPNSLLEPNTTYDFEITSALQTASGSSLPWQSDFTTGTGTTTDSASDLLPSRSPMGFTAGGAAASDSRTLTLTNISDRAISVSSLSISGEAAAQFSLADDSAFSLEAGASKELELSFTPAGLGPQLATLTVESNAERMPTLTIPLGGLGVKGQGGENEPSLQWIFDAYGLGVATGDEDPSTTGLTESASNSLLGDEVAAQAFQKASAQVTVEVLATFGVENSPVLDFGYYTAGSSSARTKLFDVQATPALNAQRLGPDVTPGGDTELEASGRLAFDPGSAPFGFYSFWPSNRFFSQRYVYSENQLNTFPDAIPHQVRAYEYRDAEGNVVPNAYVLATEEFTQGFDYNDVVVLVRGVTPVQAGSSNLQVANALGLPDPNRLLLHHINSTAGNFCPTDPDPALPPCDPAVQRWQDIFVRDSGIVTLKNLGSETLEVTLSVADPNLFNFPSNENILLLDADETYELSVEFDPQGLTDKGTVTSTLDIQAGGQSLSFPLAGIYQPAPEGSRELFIGALVNEGFGYPIDLGANTQGGITSAAADSPLVGDEVRSSYWKAASPGSPVTVTQIAAFHSCCALGDTFELYAQGNPTTPFAGMRQEAVDSNTIYPRKEGSEDLARLSANPNSPFEIRVSNYSTDPALGRGRGNLGVRLWPLIDPSGNAVANTYLAAQDYVENGCGTSSRANCDYNDNLFVIENISPAQ